MLEERADAVTLKGRPLVVLGPRLEPGDRATEVVLNDKGFDGMRPLLASTEGQVRLVNVVSSLGTGICDAQTRRINDEAAALSANLVVVTISVDLPFAQQEWCATRGIDSVVMMSDHRDMAFGNAYGTHIAELRVEQQAIFVIDLEDIVRYVQYVPEIAQHPDYDAAVAAVREVLQY